MVRVFLKKEDDRNYTLLTFYPRIYCKSSVVLEPSGLSSKKIPASNRCGLYLWAHLRCIKPKKTFPVASSMELALLLLSSPSSPAFTASIDFTQLELWWWQLRIRCQSWNVSSSSLEFSISENTLKAQNRIDPALYIEPFTLLLYCCTFD